MARRVMEQLRGELYLDQRYLTAALGALPAAPQESGGSFATDLSLKQISEPTRQTKIT